MFTVELYAGIRRAVMVDGLSRREAAKRFDVHRNTISKMLQFSVPPGYRRRERSASKKLGPFMAGSTRFWRTTARFTRSSGTRHTGFLSGCGPRKVFREATVARQSGWELRDNQEEFLIVAFDGGRPAPRDFSMASFRR